MRSIEASTDISATPEGVWDVTRFDDCPACVRCPASPPGSGRAGSRPTTNIQCAICNVRCTSISLKNPVLRRARCG
jgi:hypothetical protein